LQRTPNFSIFHLIEGSIYTYFGKHEDEKSLLKEFLVNGTISASKLENYKDWEALIETSAEQYIKKIADYLDEMEIPYFVKDLNMKFFFGFSSPFSLMVPVKYLGDAEEAIDKARDKAEDLYSKLEKAEESGDEEKQLEIYDELEKLTPGDSAVFYNKAQILLNREDYENGAAAFIESFNLDVESGQIDDIDEIEAVLNNLAEKLPENLDVLHSLATISSFRNNIDEALDRYQKILDIKENDPIAHLNLGHLYYTHTDEDEKAKQHFNKYLELEPNSIEAESVRSILENL
jgi:tetratricopeptide (TPR) repeat protein